jgi:cytoplasmic iron level regulating protein YaaA (DUF328/UPF0246 family)
MIYDKNNPMKKIILITCVAPKLQQPAPAKELYQGALFQQLIDYAAAQKPDHQFILSGKYGLLKFEDRIEPYDKNLNEVGEEELKSWAKDVLSELAKYADFEKDHFILLANPTYAKYLISAFNSYEIPLKIT